MKQQIKPKITIVGGTGKMGQWLKNFFESNALSVVIHGRKSQTTLKRVVEKSDIVIISVPIGQTEKTIHAVSPFLKKDALLTDIASLKVIPMQAMEKVSCGTLGMHPLFGPSLLMPAGQKIVFCKQKNNKHVLFLKRLFQKNGIEIIEMSAKEHDKHMAVIQGLTHAVNILFAQTIQQNPTNLASKLQTPLFTLQTLTMGRVLQQDTDLVASIQQLNPHFLPILQSFTQNLRNLISIIENKDKAKFESNMKIAQEKNNDLAPYTLRQTNKIIQMLNSNPLPIKKTTLGRGNPKSSATIAYLGPPGTNTHSGAETIFNSAKALPKQTLDDVFNSVIREQANLGIVPAENSLQGTVHQTLDLLSNSPVQVIGSVDLPIHHSLLSLEKDLNNIKSVASHPQALAQCKEWLSANLPNSLQIATLSTTSSLQHPKKNEGYIANEKAGDLYNIPIVANGIEDNRNNSTRFYVISLQDKKLVGLNRNHTLLFITIFNRVGILRDILDIFAKNNISLSKLESRPSLEKMWDYCFYLEVDAHPDSKELLSALDGLRPLCTTVNILGRT